MTEYQVLNLMQVSFIQNSMYFVGMVLMTWLAFRMCNNVRNNPNVNLAGVPPPTSTSYNFGGNGGVEVGSFATVIPEPATIGLMGIAAAGLFSARRKVRV